MKRDRFWGLEGHSHLWTSYDPFNVKLLELFLTLILYSTIKYSILRVNTLSGIKLTILLAIHLSPTPLFLILEEIQV